ncbi:MAG TPA: hypothetical protein VM364_16300 [Vicinamibacterales bacterium]|nr:hypothetical protein [Vicinamibacterales bacterium]
MSKRNNVNPGQYKVAGREKPDTIARERFLHRGNEKATSMAGTTKSAKPKKNR